MRLPPFTTTTVGSLLIALGIGLARPVWSAEIRVLNANALTIAPAWSNLDGLKQLNAFER